MMMGKILGGFIFWKNLQANFFNMLQHFFSGFSGTTWCYIEKAFLPFWRYEPFCIFEPLQFYCTLNTMQKGDTVKANRNSVRAYRKFTFELCACNHLSIQHKIHYSNDHNLPQVSFIELQVVDYFARLKNSLSFLKSGKSFFAWNQLKSSVFFLFL